MARWPIDIQVVIEDKNFRRYINKAIKLSKDLQTPLKRCSVHMFHSFAQNFRQEGRPKRWRSLSPNTIAGRRRRSSKILQDRGRLRMSTISKGAKGNIYELKRDSLKMGSNLNIARFQQEGTNPYLIHPRGAKVLRIPTAAGIIYRPSVRHPGLSSRPFILFQPGDVEECTNIFMQHLGEA